jgi:hypothetical protein
MKKKSKRSKIKDKGRPSPLKDIPSPLKNLPLRKKKSPKKSFFGSPKKTFPKLSLKPPSKPNSIYNKLKKKSPKSPKRRFNPYHREGYEVNFY